ncbi:hypothetical protein CGRA01v4_11706 [Colletotrichum graminicola]|nr:hypothetical protein CGRA01v4_11706 [Colletotrichum graminicola]
MTHVPTHITPPSLCGDRPGRPVRWPVLGCAWGAWVLGFAFQTSLAYHPRLACSLSDVRLNEKGAPCSPHHITVSSTLPFSDSASGRGFPPLLVLLPDPSI